MKAEKLAFLTDIEGVYKDPDDPSTLISELEVAEAKKLMDDGYIGGGMLPSSRIALTRSRAECPESISWTDASRTVSFLRSLRTRGSARQY